MKSLKPLENEISAMEAAKLLGVSDARIRQLILSKQLRATKRGKAWCIDKDDLEAYVESRIKPNF